VTDPTATDTGAWNDWLRRWDAQQEVYIESRERRFEVMVSFLEAVLPPDLLALDLAAGPGSASARLLRRLPGSRSVAVDADPVLLRLGEGAQGDHGGRLRWVQADLRDPSWVDALGQDAFDAVISTTALHWLAPPEVAQVYRQLAGLLRPGGVLLNGDLLPLPVRLSRIRAAVTAVDERRQAAALARGSQAWQDWWDTLRGEPALRDAFAERDRLWPDGTGTGQRSVGLAFHEAALLEAGFDEVGVVWQDLEERVLVALR
jgi:SAM-dependent methyltransferase